MRFFIFGITLAVCLEAQQPPRGWSDWERELTLRALQQNPTQQEQVIQRRLARAQEQAFVQKLNRFVQTWGKLVGEYNTRGTFNYKAAHEVTKAFHALEKSEGWPAR